VTIGGSSRSLGRVANPEGYVLTDRETPDPLGFLFGGVTDETAVSSAAADAQEPTSPLLVTPPEQEPAPVYRSRREMRAAGGYLRPTAPQTPAAAPEAVAPTTSSLPIVLPSVASSAASDVPAVPAVPDDDAAADVTAADVTAADIALPAVEAPTSRRALREAQAAVHNASARAPRDRTRTRAARPEKARIEAPRDAASAQRRRKIRDRITAGGVMVIVGGLFAALALPAYADSGSGGVALVSARAHGSQALGVDASLDKVSTTRDDYSATSAEDLRALYASALRQKNLSAYLASGSAQQGNDYPWPDQLSRNQGGGLSPLGYYYRECVDFVAWRLNRDAGASAGGPYVWTWSNLTPSGGNASQWKAAWLNHGWATGTTPEVGAVAWFPGQNHVAYVSGILQSGQIVIDEYNMGGQHEYDQRVIDPSTVEFLYAPPR